MRMNHIPSLNISCQDSGMLLPLQPSFGCTSCSSIILRVAYWHEETKSLSHLIILYNIFFVSGHPSLPPASLAAFPFLGLPYCPSYLNSLCNQRITLNSWSPDPPISAPTKCQDYRPFVTCVLFQMNEKWTSLAIQQAEADTSQVQGLLGLWNELKDKLNNLLRPCLKIKKGG